jgi:hypothetical protein
MVEEDLLHQVHSLRHELGICSQNYQALELKWVQLNQGLVLRRVSLLGLAPLDPIGSLQILRDRFRVCQVLRADSDQQLLREKKRNFYLQGVCSRLRADNAMLRARRIKIDVTRCSDPFMLTIVIFS